MNELPSQHHSPLRSIENSNEPEVCSICFEEWTNSGQHQIVSTPCGHLFGKICIETWIRTTPHCPQCHSFTKRRDLRRIFCRAIQTIDTTERDNAIRERDLERKTRRILEYEKAELQLAFNTLKEECKRLQAENERLLKLSLRRNLPSINLQLEAMIKIPEGTCRVLAYASSHQWLFVSQPSDKNSTPGFGIKKITFVNDIPSFEYIDLHHTKPIRDLQIHDDLLLSCAWDRTLRIFNCMENSSIFLCICNSQVWSCSWNLDDSNIMYAGLNNGQIQVFDRRQTQMNETTLSSSIETLNLLTSSPILSLQYIQKNAFFHSNGLLVGSNNKSGFFQLISNSEYHFHELPIDKNLSSLHYDPTTNYLIASFRPQSNPTRHELYEFKTQFNPSLNISLQLIQTFIGSSTNIILSRSKILQKNAETYLLASDNGSHGIEIWNIRQPKSSSSFKLVTDCDIVDICLTHQYLCTLADNQIRLYKWM